MLSAALSLLLGGLLASTVLEAGAEVPHFNTSSANSPLNATTSRALARVCTPPSNALDRWFYNGYLSGPYKCTTKGDSHGQWTMLNAYRSGGSEGTHWVYAKSEHDRRCLQNWTYYGKNGKTVLAQIKGRVAFEDDGSAWCALRVYRSGGVEGKQWAYCNCRTTNE